MMVLHNLQAIGKPMPRLEWKIYEAGYCTHPERATNRNASFRSCEFPALVSMLKHPVHGVILFDTGYSRHFIRATSRFPECLYRMVTPVHVDTSSAVAVQLERDGIHASDVAWIVISHLHGDHVGGLGDFQSAQLACAKEAWHDMHSRSRIGALRKGLLPSLVDAQAQARLKWIEEFPIVPLEGALARFGKAHDLFGDTSVLLIALPGHAAGHYGLLFEDCDGPVFLIADASWSSQGIRDSTPPPAFVTAWLGDTASYRHTLMLLNAVHREMPEIRIVPSHCREWRPEKKVPAHA
jgi:glyoxylase-like metal-dependent hydrolase (beta-lactamase superfamily II)